MGQSGSPNARVRLVSPARGSPRLDTFSPGPYNQLAAVMDAAGHPTIAAAVRYHRSHAERLEVPWTRPDRWDRQLYWLVLGYGFRPWQALG